MSRVAFAERDALVEQVRALVPALSEAADAAERPDIVPQIAASDPRYLEELVAPMRTPEERIAITVRCRDADALPRVANAGAVIREEDGTMVQLMHNGIKVLAGGYYGGWMQDRIVRCKGVHEPQEEVVFDRVMQHLPHSATMIELGGFRSYYSIWFLTSGEKRRAIVVEPDPAHIEVGRINARLNGANRSLSKHAWGVSRLRLPCSVRNGLARSYCPASRCQI